MTLPLLSEADVARAPSQPCAGEDPPPQGRDCRSVSWLLKKFCDVLSLHPGHRLQPSQRHRVGGWDRP